MCAAATTSLPESLGGVATGTTDTHGSETPPSPWQALLLSGYTDEAASWARWLRRAVAGSPGELQIMYGVGGERRLTEIELDCSSRLRGLKAGTNRQRGLDPVPARRLRRGAGLRADLGQERVPSARSTGIHTCYWPSCATSSRCGTNLTMGSGRSAVPGAISPTPRSWPGWRSTGLSTGAGSPVLPSERVAQWTQLRERIHADVCDKGFDTELNSFTQFYGSKLLDASLLMLAPVGFLPPDDPRIVGTVAAIQKDWSRMASSAATRPPLASMACRQRRARS